MKPLYTLLFGFCFSILYFNSGFLSAQCPTCVPDANCIGGEGMPAICPLTPPEATAGVYYEEVITFYLPETVTDPGTGFEATLIDVSIASVTGLPYGLVFTLNDADGIFHPSAGDNLGCATICGTPILPGTYDVVITVDALVTVLGFEANQAQSFASVLVVVPGEGSANSFSYNNIAGCGSVDVTYEALISIPAPSVTTYAWDFGNGETGEGANPPVISYSAPGTYNPSLTTIVSDYVLESVSVSGLNGNWDDLEELFTDADPYFIITDANGGAVYTSSIASNTSATIWTTSVTMTNPPYTIQFLDDDDISANDDMGSIEIPLTIGQNPFDIGNGTAGTFTLNMVVSNQLTDAATITVFDIPDATVLQDENVLSLVNPDFENVIWYQNGSPIDGQFDASITLTEGGQYFAIVSNEFGCTAQSETFTYCAPVLVIYDEVAQELLVEDIYASYQWSYNGLPLDGATSYYHPTTDPGNYSVTVTTDYGCETTSNVYVLINDIEESGTGSLMAYPNPSSGLLNIMGSAVESGATISVVDILGHQVLTIATKLTPAGITIDASGIAPGIYFIVAGNERIRWIKK